MRRRFRGRHRSSSRRPVHLQSLEPRTVLDSTVVFNEVMYNPAGNDESLEWIELHNQMAVDMDLSKWELEGGINFTFTEGTIIPGGGYLVIAANKAALASATGFNLAVGDYTGVLDNNGEEIRLVDRNERLLDTINYRDEGSWPVAPDGSGASLAKIGPQTPSGPAENWTSSLVIGGTPGARNFPEANVGRILVNLNQQWRFEATGTDLGTNWRQPGYSDAAWGGENAANLLSYWPLDGNANALRGTNGTLVAGPTPTTDRNGVAGGALSFAATSATTGSYVNIADGGGLNGALQGTVSMWVKWTGTQDGGAGNAFGPVLARQNNGVFSNDIIALNVSSPSIGRPIWRQNSASTTNVAGTSAVGDNVWRHIAVRFSTTSSEMFVDGVSQGTGSGGGLNASATTPLTIGAWIGDGAGYSTSSIDDVAIWDQQLSASQIQKLAAKTKSPLDYSVTEPAVYYAGSGQVTGIPDPRQTQLPATPNTFYFRTTFNYTPGAQQTALFLSNAVDDGAVYYLNGQELYRQNMPDGNITYATKAQNSIGIPAFQQDIPVPATALQAGTNVLAVEVHQGPAAQDSEDMIFGAQLVSRDIIPNAPLFASPAVVFNEVQAAATVPFTVELTNRSAAAVNIGGMVVKSTSGAEYVLPAQSLVAGTYLALTQAQLGFTPLAGDRLFLLNSARTRVEDGAEVKPTHQGRWPNGSGEWMSPDAATFGAANVVTLRDEIVINEVMYHHRPTFDTPGTPAILENIPVVPIGQTWTYNRAGANLGSTWYQSTYTQTVTNPPNGGPWRSGAGPIGFDSPITAPEVPLQTFWTFPEYVSPFVRTYYFQTQFNFTGLNPGSTLRMRHLIDDGAAFYINGVEIPNTRFNLPAAPATLDGTTQALSLVNNAVYSNYIDVPVAMLQIGNNILSAEVHQFDTGGVDVVFGMELVQQRQLAPPIPPTTFGENPEEWIELYNRSNHSVDLSGWSFSAGVDYTFPANTSLGPQQYLVVAKDAVALAAKFPGITIVGNYGGTLNDQDDRIELDDARGNPADEFHYYEGGRWPEFADGGGSSLELRNPDMDNSTPEAWASSDETSRSAWQTITYQGVAGTSAIGPDAEWNELVLGMLDSGEVLLDDIRVTLNPTGTPVSLIQNGTFEADTVGGPASKWRIVGNHGGTVIVDSTNPNNKVLKLVAGGDTDHMSNHAETTLKNGATFHTISSTSTYEISMRAKWINGSPQLLSRLYFNRLARATILSQPALSGTPGTQNSRFIANPGPTYSAFRHSPAVPQAFEPVTVTATAADPNGVASMTVWYSVAGGPWISAPMTTSGGGNYSGTIPGQGASTLVQFYVEGVDTLGAVSTFPADGVNSRAMFKVNDGLAATNGLHNLRIVMTAADAAKLHDPFNLMSNGRIPATVIYNENEIFYDVGVRLKGSEHSRVSTLRLGFNVEFHPEQLFRGTHQTVSIDRSESTFFGQREMLSHQTINHAGGIASKYNDLIQVITPQLAHTGSAELQMARYGQDYLDSQYDNGSDGRLYEYELVYLITNSENNDPEGRKIYTDTDGAAGIAIQNMGDAKENYRWTYLLKNNADEDDFTRIIEWAKAMGAANPTFNSQIGSIIDVDQWLRSFAQQNVSGAGDSFGGDGAAAHNVQFYVRPEDNKVLMLPHDLDAFYNVNAPLVSNNAYLGKLIVNPGNAHNYYGHMHDILSTTYNGTYMAHWANNYGQLLPGQPFASHLQFVIQRSNKLLTDINTAVPFVAYNVTPTDLEVATATATVNGTGWVNMRTLRKAGDPNPLPLTWNTVTGWQATVPVEPGVHPVTLEAYDFQGNLIASDTVNINSTLSTRPQQDFLRVTELMYHPADPTALESPPGSDNSDDYEFIELKNISTTQTIDLAGAEFVDGIEYAFPDNQSKLLAPGEHILLVKDVASFNARYGPGLNVVGPYSGRLDNAGEHLQLVDLNNVTILDFTYSPLWYPQTDGIGPSLNIVDPLGDLSMWNVKGGWFQGRSLGTPGAGETASQIVGRHVFYNNSKFDGNNPAANTSDDAAIATDKTALLPAGTASFANYTSFNRGLNGLMIDMANLPAGATLDASDFIFKVGNNDTPATWATLAAAPTVSVRPAPGLPGTSRVTLVWPTGAAIKQWLQVTVKANANTGLLTQDVFYFGNAVGESGNVVGDYSVSITDELLARNNPVGINPGALVTSRFDYNRDGTVSVVDQLLARNNITTAATRLRQIIVANLVQPSGLVAQALSDENDRIASGLLTSAPSSSTSTILVSSSMSAVITEKPSLNAQAARVAYGEPTSNSLPRRPSAATDVDDSLLELLAKGH